MFMKNPIVLASSFLSCSMNVQDFHLKTNGDIHAVKVIEVGTNAVSFIKFNYLEELKPPSLLAEVLKKIQIHLLTELRYAL